MGLAFNPDDFARKLKVVHGDHAKDVTKYARLLQNDWKKSVTRRDLGLQKLAAAILPSVNATLALLSIILTKATTSAGGDDIWAVSSPQEQEELLMTTFWEVVRELGDVAFTELTPAQQRSVDFDLRVGCCMHKEMNCAKAFCSGMAASWTKLGDDVAPPVLLANKANANTISRSAADSEAARNAVKESSRGGPKLTLIAGAIYNHKDPDKGHQEIFRMHSTEMKTAPGMKHPPSVTFPDTSANRFQTTFRAACELVTYLPWHLWYLALIHDRKEKAGFNHQEANLDKGLRDPATITELCCMALAYNCILAPYARQTRLEGLNHLDLKPVHDNLLAFIRRALENPDLLIESTASDAYKTASLDGLPWEHPQSMTALHELRPTLPHFCAVFVAGLEASLEAWIRFTSEFEDGGLIATSTPEERFLAFTPSTNDANEGSLGETRIDTREHPTQTIEHTSAKLTSKHNHTQEFIDALCLPEDHMYFRRLQRIRDSSGMTKWFRDAFLQATIQTVETKRTEAAVKARKLAEKMARLAAVGLCLDEAKIHKMLDDALKEQLEVYRTIVQDKDVPLKSHLKRKAEHLVEVLAALERYRRSVLFA